jgi:thiosulfate/3-mercaptopyruvate sulfurtransferase
MEQYAHPEVLVGTDWVRENIDKPGLRLIEIDLDTKAYEAVHIPGAIAINWQTQLQDQVQRDILRKDDFEKLASSVGITPDDTLVFYGDHNNWFAAYGFWQFKIFGHRDVRLMDGGRTKWLNDPGNPVTREEPRIQPSVYKTGEMDPSNRILASELLKAVHQGDHNLLDVRTRDEFTGKVIAPIGMGQTAQRGGHIPGAVNIPWNMSVQPDGTFKTGEELRSIYVQSKAVDPKKETIVYCRIGERCSHSWFVLKYLLGLEKVRNYDGSWTEYGNLIGVPIEKSF